MMDYPKKMTLFVISDICCRIKSGTFIFTDFSDKEISEVIDYAIKIRVANFIKKFNLDLTSKELYNILNGIKETPKCEFCGKPSKFVSLSKGYKNNCGSKDCIRKAFLLGNSKRKIENQKSYDVFLKEHSDFYKSVSFPFTDPFDGKIVKSATDMRWKSFSNLKILDETKECLFCHKSFIFNRFNRHNEVCDSCNKGNPKKYLNFYKDYSDIDFKTFKYNFKLKTFTNDELRSLSKKYSPKQLHKLIQGNAKIVNGYYLERAFSKDNFRYLFNNIIEPDMKAICACCGKEYVKYDKILIDGELVKKRIGAEFTCGNPQCYFSCLNMYERTDDTITKQSNALKKLISEGKFTPAVTNSWTRTKIFEQDGIKFRSSWEFLFYLITKDKKKLEYERIRIPYFDSELQKTRNYIVDFYEPLTRTIFEIKPEGFEKELRNKEKFTAALEFSRKNNINFKIINEKFFKMYYNNDILEKIYNIEIRNKCKKLWRQFEC